MYNLADIVSTGYQTGAKIGQDITAGNILQEAYKGVDAADPQAAVRQRCGSVDDARLQLQPHPRDAL